MHLNIVDPTSWGNTGWLLFCWFI